jgi:hypothetical protein
VGDDSYFVFRQKLLGENGSVRRSNVVVKQPGLFSPKSGATSSYVITHSPQNVALEPGIHSWDKFFVHNPLDITESDGHALDIASHLSGPFGLRSVGLFYWEDCCFVLGS